MFRKKKASIVLAFAIILGIPCVPQLEAETDGTKTDDFENALFSGTSIDNQETSGKGAFDDVSTGGEKAATEYLAGGTIVVEAGSTIDKKSESATTNADAAGKVFAKVSVPDYGSLFVAYGAKQHFLEGYSGDGTAPLADDPYKPTYNLSELYYSFDIAKHAFFRFGNQLVSWGPSRIWSPVDFINLEKEDAFSTLDSRTGKSGLKVTIPFNHANVFFFSDFSGMMKDGVYGDPAKTTNYAGRLDFTAIDFEFGLTGYGGMNAQGRGGADFSGRILGTTVYGELAHFFGYDHWTPGLGASLGFSRTLDELKRWTLSAEGFYNSRGKDLSGYTAASIATVPSDESIPLYQGSYYAYVALAADKLFSPALAATASALANLQDRSYLLKLSEDVSFPRAVPFTLAVTWTGGGENREFTRYPGNGAIGVTASTKIEF